MTNPRMATTAAQGTITARCAVCLRAACRAAALAALRLVVSVALGVLIGAAFVAVLAVLEVHLPW